MKRIIYNGDISPCRIVIFGAEFRWSDGEIKELDDAYAKKLVEDNERFTYVDGATVKVDKKDNEIDSMSKDDLLDLTAKKDIKADYRMNKDELKKKIKDNS